MTYAERRAELVGYLRDLPRDSKEYDDAQDALYDLLYNDLEHCPKCGEPFAWDGDTEASRICPSCQTPW